MQFLQSLAGQTSLPESETFRDVDGRDLLEYQPELALLTITSNCNLRCTYCAVSQPGYFGEKIQHDFDLSQIDKLIVDFKNLGVRIVQVNGHGETTMIKGWHTHAQKFLNEGFTVWILSNFARAFEPEEIDVLSRFERIIISIDTVDQKLLREIRRHSDVRTILTNILKVRAKAVAEGREPPRFSWNSVVSDAVAGTLVDYITTGLAVGVTQFDFLSLVKFPDLPNALNVYHPSTLPPERIQALLDELQQVREIAARMGASVSIQHGLEEPLKKALDVKRHNEPAAHSKREDVTLGSQKTIVEKYSIKPSEKQTRDCLDPWTYSQIGANGSVQLCCVDGSQIGYTSSEKSFTSIVSGEKARAFRKQLLTGEMEDVCATCYMRDLTTVEELQKKVSTLVAEKNSWRAKLNKAKASLAELISKAEG